MNPHTHCLRSLCAFLAALVLAVCLACPALADAPLVRDEYGLFDADTLAQLESSAEDASAGHDCDVYFLTVDSIGDTDQRAYAKNYYVQNDLGSGSGKSGILFMIALGSRKYVTITYGGGVTAFTDYRIEQLEDEVVPLLSDGDYADAAQTYIDLCASTLDFYAENGEPLDYDNDPDGGLGLIGILIVDGALFSFEVKQIKPEPEIYHSLLERFHLRAEECVFLDDRQNNVDGAIACGISAIRFTGYEDARQKLKEYGVEC